jgi:hypothetical protein
MALPGSLLQNPALQVMIGSIGEEAAKIRAALPAGHGHVVLDTTLLPSTFRYS